MEWKQCKPKLEELAERAGRGDEVGRLLSDSVATITEQLDHLHKTAVHLTQRLDTLAGQVAVLEARVHEDVE